MAINLQEYETKARASLPPAVYDFFAGGAGAEHTLRRNLTAFQEIGLVPRVLRGAGPPDLSMELLGAALSMPVVIAPTAFHRLATAAGEIATARAARLAGTVMILSMASTVAVEQVIQESAHDRDEPLPEGNFWFQLYLQPDRGFTQALAERAKAAGCRALVLTVDSPTFGRRERDLRHGFQELPAPLECAHMREPGTGPAAGRTRAIEFDDRVGWKDVDWLRSITDLPLFLKGMAHPEDAKIALEHGVAGLIVSNHGGRQLDSGVATIELLPDIAEVVDGRLPLLMDGGIRRGTDVAKALALGADAVAVGRPILWGLAVAGERGARDVLELLCRELRDTLLLCGCRSSDDLDRRLLRMRSRQP